MTSGESLILDTHVWVWWVDQNDKLPRALRERIERARRAAISAASVYELTFAVARKRLWLPLDLDDWLCEATDEADIAVAPINAAIAKRAAQLPQVHGDPLDRIIIATALSQRARLLSLDAKFSGYDELADLLVSR